MSNSLMRDSVEHTVIAVVEDLIQDWGLDIDEIDGRAKLVADLQFASVDIIQLCVALEQAYERKFGFQDLLMKDGSYVGDLSLAQFAHFIESKLTT
ncbi:acyl carrier protein [Aquabacterium sp.]|uniref:acyl carrier protein n=1 Tax=Aquabacterium sp. TaxID=1872578 RepID=UPI002BE1462F|nr:acyl carrier protein [Aquabacterium sp.]HSW05871.1 acyl carrier protein [Aquabacterium sp.]